MDGTRKVQAGQHTIRAGMLAGGLLAPLLAGLAVLAAGGPARPLGLALILGAGAAVLALAAAVPVAYEVAPPDLIVRHGWLRWRLPLAAITGVEPGRGPGAAPAGAPDRLLISYRPPGAGVRENGGRGRLRAGPQRHPGPARPGAVPGPAPLPGGVAAPRATRGGVGIPAAGQPGAAERLLAVCPAEPLDFLLDLAAAAHHLEWDGAGLRGRKTW